MEPLINILIRTSNRPNYFAGCVQSIVSQTYSNYRIHVCADNDESFRYASDMVWSDGRYPSKTVRVSPTRAYRKPIDEKDEALLKQYPNLYYAPYNLYLNQLKAEIDEGWLVFLDDDDMLVGNDALAKLSQRMVAEDAVVFWRVRFSTGVVPSDAHWKHPPGTVGMSGIGFSYHSKHKCLAWDQFSTSDRRIMHAAWHCLDTHVWANEILTGVQRKDDFGRGRRDDVQATPGSFNG